MNNRRKLIIALGAGALTAPHGSFAQKQGKVWRVGYLTPGPRNILPSPQAVAFLQGMRELGYVEGKNLVMVRPADGTIDQLPELAAELVRLKVDVILAPAQLPSLAAQKATTTIPIVMVSAPDPVASGLVKTLARPGGNITGFSTITHELNPKRLEMLLDMLPKLSRVAVLKGPDQTHSKALEGIQAAGDKRRVQILPVEAQTPQEIENAFSVVRQQNAGALLVLLYPLFQRQRSQIAELAANHRLPTITADRRYAEAGCLLSYGVSIIDLFRRSATYVDKILKGAKPADLPVEQPTTFDFVVNLKTAKAFGLTIPPEIMVRATEVIQ